MAFLYAEIASPSEESSPVVSFGVKKKRNRHRKKKNASTQGCMVLGDNANTIRQESNAEELSTIVVNSDTTRQQFIEKDTSGRIIAGNAVESYEHQIVEEQVAAPQRESSTSRGVTAPIVPRTPRTASSSSGSRRSTAPTSYWSE
jgi:hypothetical protein